MKKGYFFILILFSLVKANAHNSIHSELHEFPPYDVVVANFFSSYSYVSTIINNDNTLSFAKKRDGWYVHLENSFSKKVLFESLFWDRNSNYWRHLNLTTISPDLVSENSQYIDYFLADTSFFKANLYYGYRGWESDVIQDLSKPATFQNEEDLYMLGRAYSSIATMTLFPSIKFYNDFIKYDSTLDIKDVPSEVVEKFINYSDSSILCYDIVYHKDRDFLTFVGNIEEDYSNEHIKAFIWLSMVGKQKIGEKYLIDGLYNKFAINFYRNFLLSCDSTAIVFAMGDNDVYGLTYLQSKFGIRKDITIVVQNFLGLGRYIHYLAHLAPDCQKINFGLDVGSYKLRENEVIYLNQSNTFLSDAGRLIERYRVRDKLSDSVFGDRLKVTLDLDKANPSHPICFSDTSAIDNQLTWIISQNPYMLREELAFLDLLSGNNSARPIVFSSMDKTYGLSGHLRHYGLGFKLFAESNTYSDCLDAIDEMNYFNLLYKFNFVGLDSSSKYNKTVNYLCDKYLSLVYDLSNNLITKNDDCQGAKILDKYFELFPDTLINFHYQSSFLIKQYYRMGRSDKGDSLLTLLAYRARNKLLIDINHKNYDITEIERNIGTINNLKDIIVEYSRPKYIVQKIEKIRQSMREAYDNF